MNSFFKNIITQKDGEPETAGPALPLAAIAREHRWLFIAFSLFMMAGAIGLLLFNQGDLVLFFSNHRSYWNDLFFKSVTTMGEGYFFLIGLVLLLFYRYRFALALSLLGVSVSVVSYVSKEIFSHPRPLAYFRDHNLLDRLVPVEGVHVHDGPTSFPSGHTMAAFALYFFLAFCLPRNKGIGGLLFLGIALAVGFSRVYLAQHFFKDIYFGAILGGTLAVFWFWMAQRLWPIPHSRLDNALGVRLWPLSRSKERE